MPKRIPTAELAALIDAANASPDGLTPIDNRAIRSLAEPLVEPLDLDAFVALAANELFQLHEGNLARHRLRPSEFQCWQVLHSERKPLHRD